MKIEINCDISVNINFKHCTAQLCFFLQTKRNCVIFLTMHEQTVDEIDGRKVRTFIRKGETRYYV